MSAHLCIIFRRHKSESMRQSRFWFTGTLHSEKVYVTSIYSVGLEPQKGSQMPNSGNEGRDIQEGGTGTGTRPVPSRRSGHLVGIAGLFLFYKT